MLKNYSNSKSIRVIGDFKNIRKNKRFKINKNKIVIWNNKK